MYIKQKLFNLCDKDNQTCESKWCKKKYYKIGEGIIIFIATFLKNRGIL